MVTGQQIADTTLEAIRCDGGYIWGQMGAEWTDAKQNALEKRYKENPSGEADYKYSALYGRKWVGHRVWDCAGLCRWAAKQHGIDIHAGSNLIWNCDLVKRGELTKGMKLPVGALVFTGTASKKPHIGTYTGDGLVTEASGTIDGCKQSELHGGKWKYWGLEKGVTYEFIPGEEPVLKGYARVTGTRVALRRDPSTSGTIISRIQTGETVKINDFPKEWDYVSFKDKKGWMMREFLKEEGDRAIVTGKRVALRQERSTRAKVITRINTNETVKIDTPPKEEWDYVSYDGKAGYMMREFLKEG